MIVSPVRAVDGGLDAELRFDAPASRVFSYISDLRNMEAWWPEHVLYRRLRGDGGAGSLYTWIYVLGIVPALGFTRIVAHDRDERFEYRAGFPGMAIRIGYRFSPDSAGTRATFQMRTALSRAPGFAKVAGAEATRAFERLDRELTRT
jgi:hypothetical protein